MIDCGGGWFSKTTETLINAREVCEEFGFTTIDKYGSNGGTGCSKSNDRNANCGWKDGKNCGLNVDFHCTSTKCCQLLQF